jgi:hypothetical protein
MLAAAGRAVNPLDKKRCLKIAEHSLQTAQETDKDTEGRR